MDPYGVSYLDVGEAFYNRDCRLGPSDDPVRCREYQRVFGHHASPRLRRASLC